MKYSHLCQIVASMQHLRKINAAYRVDDTTLKIAFDRDETYYFAMQKGDPYIFTCKQFQRSKVYQAPFDVMLAKSFSRADIERIEVHNRDKIVRIHASLQGSYKASSAVLQLEFTGKHANAIILDSDGVVLEALRHVDAQSSFRAVRVGQPLLEVPPPPYVPKEYPLESVAAFLEAAYHEREEERLEQFKLQKIAMLHKKLERIEALQAGLIDQQTLEAQALEAQHRANLILGAMHRIKPYATRLELQDYDGSPVEVVLPRAFATVPLMADYLFKQSKRLKKKAASLHIEREGLSEKADFLRHFIDTVRSSGELSALKALFNAPGKQEKQESEGPLQSFWIEGYKVLLGKSERGNVVLLSQAKARDIWLHLKDRPSAHVLIVTDKQQVPQNVLEFAAKLCVDFSVFEKGRYLVDYTPRREVKVQEGANVLYTNAKTVMIEKG
ncbi:MAG: DUF814 domain-containing protein [Campylobacterales bacterium]|nr:DUF814 domain-containing protein [Campylobacterales bacterium]